MNEKVQGIILDVRENGDAAIRKYARQFDGVEMDCLEVTKKEIREAYAALSEKELAAIKKAASNIKWFAEKQKPKEWMEEREGMLLGQIVKPLDSVGVYVPGGNYPLPSSALMGVIPAKVAGVGEIVVCSPKARPAVLVAADIAGADRIFRIGGVQAIAAMAYGTESVPKVSKIVGPGNAYVTAAKKLLFGEVGIDMLAGPTEVMIIADENANPKYIAADMLAQMEHDTNAEAILVTTSKEVAAEVEKQLERQLETLSTSGIASEAKKEIIVVGNLGEAFELANERAPEHLEIMIPDEGLLEKVRNAGAVFIGEYSVEAGGDYATGPNHVLPTGGFAKARAGLSVMDFVKMPSVQIVSKEGLENLRETVGTLADMEGLEAHKKSVEVRFDG
ncbi:MAG: histidinol dehydrogenase [Candidatus Diapherotrites archaeon]|nr:histidinol dehydrogenase [Candidatus Diapherotrites archaeon]